MKKLDTFKRGAARAPVILTGLRRDSLIAHSLKAPASLFVGLNDGLLVRNGLAVYAPPVPRRFFIALAAASPGIVSRDELIEILYGDDDEGGPEDDRGMIRSMADRARLIAAALRYSFSNEWGRGYSVWPTRASMAPEASEAAE